MGNIVVTAILASVSVAWAPAVSEAPDARFSTVHSLFDDKIEQSSSARFNDYWAGSDRNASAEEDGDTLFEESTGPARRNQG